MSSGRGFGWFVGLVVGALLPLAPMSLLTAPANADPPVFDGKEIKDLCTISSSGQSCPVFPGPPPLLNPGAAASAGPDVAASLQRLSDKAVANTLADHQLPASDRDAVLSYGRADAQAELWALIVEALQTDAGSRTTDQQNAVTWMTTMTTAQSLQAALDAGAEYTRWAGLYPAEFWSIARTATQQDLTTFLATDVRTKNPSDQARGGYCRYTAPSPYNTKDEYDGSTSPNCFDACTSVLGCAVPTPSYDQFVKWGQAVAASEFDTSDPVYAAQARAIASGVGFGATLAVAAAAATGLATTLSSVLATEVVSTIIWSAVADVFATAAGAGAAVIGAIAIVIFAIVAAVLEGIRVSENAALPGKIAELITDARSATTDASTKIGTTAGTTELYYYFVSATLPVPRHDLACDNSLIPPWAYTSSYFPDMLVYVPLGHNQTIMSPADRNGCLNPPPIPPASPTDAHFLVTTGPTPNFQAAPTLSMKDPATGTPITVRLHDSWFIQQGAGGATQSLRLSYTDWEGDAQLAWLIPDAVNGGYEFIGLQDNDSVTALNADTCDTDGVCWERKEIDYLGTDGQRYTAKVELTAAATGADTPTYSPASPLEASPVSFDAGDFAPGSANGPLTYTWRFQHLGCGWIECVRNDQGVPAPPSYSDPVTGKTATYTWESIGPAKVELTAADQHSHSATTVFVVNVGNVPPHVLALHQNDASVGVPVTLQSTLGDAGTGDDLNIQITYGDGAQDTYKVGPNSPNVNPPANLSVLDLPGNDVGFLATHTYTQPGIYYGAVSVSDWGGGTATDSFVVQVTGKQQINFPAVPDGTYGAAVEMQGTGSASMSSVTYSAGPAEVCTPLDLTGKAVLMVGVGTCTVTAHQEADLPIYLAADTVQRTFDVGPADLTITADDKTKVYGAADPELTASYDGLVNGDTKDDLPGVTLTGPPSGANAGQHDITASGATNPNYDITYVTGTETITPAPLTITADDKTRVYGDDFPNYTFSFDGLVNGDDAGDFPGLTLSGGGPAGAAVDDYVMTPFGADNTNYDITYVDGTEHVIPAPLTITADDKTRVYGDDFPNYTASFDGLVNGDDEADVTGLSFGGGAPAHAGVGDYPLTVSGASSPNYDISFVDGTEHVVPAPLTITADGKTKVYGAPAPELTATFDGLVNGDTRADVTGLVLAGPPSGAGVGAYAITASGATNPNYDIGFAPGIETVTPAPLTIRPDDVTIASGGVPSYAWHSEGWVNGDSDANLSLAPDKTPTCVATVDGAAAWGAAPGIYPRAVTCSGASDANYVIAYATASLQVNPVISLDQRGLPASVTHRAFVDSRPVVLPAVRLPVRFGAIHNYRFPPVVIEDSGMAHVTDAARFEGEVTADIDVTARYLTMSQLLRRADKAGRISRREAERLDERWQEVSAWIGQGRNVKARDDMHRFADRVRHDKGDTIRAATAQDLLNHVQAVYAHIGGAGKV